MQQYHVKSQEILSSGQQSFNVIEVPSTSSMLELHTRKSKLSIQQPHFKHYYI